MPTSVLHNQGIRKIVQERFQPPLAGAKDALDDFSVSYRDLLEYVGGLNNGWGKLYFWHSISLKKPKSELQTHIALQ